MNTDYSLLTWEKECTNTGITYTCDDYSITGDYVGLHNEIREWVLYSFSGYSINTFNTLEEAMQAAEYLYENKE